MSPRAKAKIRQWFAKERREEALEAGKDAIAKEVRRGGLPLQRLMNAESMAVHIRASLVVGPLIGLLLSAVSSLVVWVWL